MRLHPSISILIFAGILLSACANIPGAPPPIVDATRSPMPGDALVPIELQAGYGMRGAWYELYFTDPTSPLASQATGGVDGPLVDAIDAARLSIDVAVYSLSLNSVRNALLNAHDRGVTVRMVMETGNMERSDPEILMAAGIPIVGDDGDGLMHNKFMVIDRSEVWLGSMNFTDSGTYEDNNNLMRIHSPEMAENFTKEFEEMFVDGAFGDITVPETPHPIVTLAETRIQVLFSPDDGVLNALSPLLDGAEKSIHFLAFSFTSNNLGDILLAKAEAGLTVAGVMDEGQVFSNQGTEFDPFRLAGLDVLIDGIDGQMHHKVFIVDETIVALGSYNFSKNAEERNDENLLIIHDSGIAKQFMQEFERVWGQAHE
ncbi:MAG TPA: phospholipase D-like domain-containing protein [Anaerolineales bacterium]|nr:phospholipase D-like domain-containing protein [Anaerolineales bacterium]